MLEGDQHVVFTLGNRFRGSLVCVPFLIETIMLGSISDSFPHRIGEANMQPEQPKSIGAALVDVFDAALDLVKTELRLMSRRVGNVIKAKGMGVVLLLAAAAPLSVALVFLLLALFYGLIALGLPAWASALIVAVLSLVVTGVVAMMGMKRLSAEVPDDTRAPDEDLKQAEHDLRDAERDLERQVKRSEQRVERAERDLERAESRVQHPSGGASATGAAHGTASTGAPGMAHGQPHGAAPSPGTGGRVRDTDGISVSTRPEFKDHEEEGKL